jgi:cell division protease FtsH
LIREETIESEQFEAIFDAPRPKPDLIGPPLGRRGVQASTPPATPPAQERDERDFPPATGQLRPQPAG